MWNWDFFAPSMGSHHWRRIPSPDDQWDVPSIRLDTLGDFPMRNGDFPMKNGDLYGKHRKSYKEAMAID